MNYVSTNAVLSNLLFLRATNVATKLSRGPLFWKWKKKRKKYLKKRIRDIFNHYWDGWHSFFGNLFKSGFSLQSSQRISYSKFFWDNALRYLFLRRVRLENVLSQTYVEPNMHINFGTISLSTMKLQSESKRFHNASLI